MSVYLGASEIEQYSTTAPDMNVQTITGGKPVILFDEFSGLSSVDFYYVLALVVNYNAERSVLESMPFSQGEFAGLEALKILLHGDKEILMCAAYNSIKKAISGMSADAIKSMEARMKSSDYDLYSAYITSFKSGSNTNAFNSATRNTEWDKKYLQSAMKDRTIDAGFDYQIFDKSMLFTDQVSNPEDYFELRSFIRCFNNIHYKDTIGTYEQGGKISLTVNTPFNWLTGIPSVSSTGGVKRYIKVYDMIAPPYRFYVPFSGNPPFVINTVTEPDVKYLKYLHTRLQHVSFVDTDPHDVASHYTGDITVLPTVQQTFPTGYQFDLPTLSSRYAKGTAGDTGTTGKSSILPLLLTATGAAALWYFSSR